MIKRPISIGFVKPEQMQGNTIYVQLRSEDSRCHPRAEAVSAEEFKYEAYSVGGDLLNREGTTANSTYGGGRTRSPEEFVDMLGRKNDAEVIEERFREDGLALTLQIKGIKANVDRVSAEMNRVTKNLDAI